MSKKKMSMEEKKTRMLQLFHEKAEFFLLKDLEKIAPKEKGIIANSVKDVIQKLVDDGLVDTDKIGTSIYFWAFPSKTINARKRALEDITKQLEASANKLRNVGDQLKLKNNVMEESDEKNKCLERINTLQLEKNQLAAELDHFKANNSEIVSQLQKQSMDTKEAANRWTDNIFAIKAWARNKHNIETSTMNKQFGIPEDLDYIE